MLISTDYPNDTIANEVVCENPLCEKVMLKWEGPELEYEVDPEYWFLTKEAIRSYVEFKLDNGQPLRSLPANEDPFKALNVNMYISLQDSRIVGYRTVPSNIEKKDFCSNSCAIQYFRTANEYGVCLRKNGNNTIELLSNAPDIKKEIEIVHTIPTSGGYQEHHSSINENSLASSAPPKKSNENVPYIKMEQFMETHRTMVIACLGHQSSIDQPCNTLIAIILQEQSATRCPMCNTIYVVDPFVPEAVDSDLSGFSAINFEGHRIEMFPGQKAQLIHANVDLAEEFYSSKIGGLYNVFRANIYSSPGEGQQLFDKVASKRMESDGASNLPEAPSVTKKSISVPDKQNASKILGMTYFQMGVLMLLGIALLLIITFLAFTLLVVSL